MNLARFIRRMRRRRALLGPSICVAVISVTLTGSGCGAGAPSAPFDFKGGIFTMKPAMAFSVDKAVDDASAPIDVTIQVNSWVMTGTRYSGATVLALISAPDGGDNIGSYTITGRLTFIGNGGRKTTRV